MLWVSWQHHEHYYDERKWFYILLTFTVIGKYFWNIFKMCSMQFVGDWSNYNILPGSDVDTAE